ncbi:hypothetical protein KCP76_26465 (plasmid) [Salmonella enterica subsp. enterica serovar Weltevreden]|nr:hypothetical protein KCP76_26465 [Salmonella enterica subsp. enterica serovar Weltevreden]QUI99503.1 hypothetical protein KCP74_25880 [Salmonella enterica subsp. enterica]QUJ01271.1 hypothetical protein KCP73_27205 [Salmonella enterica subsp. enterica]
MPHPVLLSWGDHNVQMLVEERDHSRQTNFSYSANVELNLETLEIIITQNKPWTALQANPHCWRSSFGIGGTNAHISLYKIYRSHAAPARGERTGSARSIHHTDIRFQVTNSAGLHNKSALLAYIQKNMSATQLPIKT